MNSIPLGKEDQAMFRALRRARAEELVMDRWAKETPETIAAHLAIRTRLPISVRWIESIHQRAMNRPMPLPKAY